MGVVRRTGRVLTSVRPRRGRAVSHHRPIPCRSIRRKRRTDHDPSFPTMLTSTARRMVVASIVQAANSAVDGLLVADALDATATGILGVSGVEDDAIARIVMSRLWTRRRAVAATRTHVSATRTVSP